MHRYYVLGLFDFALLAASQQIASDSGVSGPPLELVHVYNDEFPTGQLFLTLAPPCNVLY